MTTQNDFPESGHLWKSLTFWCLRPLWAWDFIHFPHYVSLMRCWMWEKAKVRLIHHVQSDSNLDFFFPTPRTYIVFHVTVRVTDLFCNCCMIFCIPSRRCEMAYLTSSLLLALHSHHGYAYGSFCTRDYFLRIYSKRYKSLKTSRSILPKFRNVCRRFACGQEWGAGCRNRLAALLQLWGSYWNSGLCRFPRHHVLVNLWKMTKAFVLAKKCPQACLNQFKKKKKNNAGEGRKECRFLNFLP